MEFTTGQIVAFIGFVSTIGALWRFTIKPIFDNQARLEDWRRDVNVTLILVMDAMPDGESKDRAKRLHQRLTGE